MKAVCPNPYRFSTLVAVAVAFVLVFSSIMLSGSSFADEGSDPNSDVGTPGLVYEYNEGKKVASVKNYMGDDRNVVIPSTVTKDGVVYTVTSIKESAITKDDDITSLVIPDSVTEIDMYGITSYKIKELTAPISLKFFDSSLDPVQSWNSVVLPQILTYNLTKVTLTKGSGDVRDFNPSYYNMSEWNFLGLPWRASFETIEEIVIEEGVTEIGEAMFYLCKAKYVSLPTTLNHIGKMAFRDAHDLTSINIHGEEIGDSAFKGCESLTDITLSTDLLKIGKSAFEDCTKLTHMPIPDKTTEIGSHAFKNCKSLTQITIPNSVTSLGKSALEGCKGLKKVVLSENITSIASHLFKNCTALEHISIPASVTSFEDYSFEKCKSLKTIFLEGSIDDSIEMGKDVFKDCSSDLIILFKHQDDVHTIVTDLDDAGGTLYLKMDAALSMAPNTPVTVPDIDGETQDDAILTTSVIVSILALILGAIIVRFRP